MKFYAALHRPFLKICKIRKKALEDFFPACVIFHDAKKSIFFNVKNYFFTILFQTGSWKCQKVVIFTTLKTFINECIETKRICLGSPKHWWGGGQFEK